MKQILNVLSIVFLFLILSHSGVYADIFNSDGQSISSDELDAVLLQASAADAKYVYIYSATCGHCAKAKEWLEGFHERHPDIIIEYHDISLPETLLLLEEYKARFNLKYPAVPIIFIGNLVVLEGVDAITTHFEPITVSISEQGEKSNTPEAPTASATDPTGIPILLIIGAGLLDGINPCAFAVLVLLLAYLMAVDSRRKMVIGGLIYSTAVFIFYYIAGVLLARSVQMLEVAEYFSKFAGILSIFFGLIMIKGVIFPGKGPILAIPESQKPRIDRWIKKGTFPSIFVLGVLVGMFELPCTGGIYLAIISMISLQKEIVEGLYYLLIYNIAFIMPLLIILVAVCYGMPPEKVNEWRLEKRFLLRLIVGVIMIILGVVVLSGILY